MRKVIVETWLSLDGYATDQNGKMDALLPFIRESHQDAHRREFLHTVDTILFGRHTYAQFAALWPDRPVENDPVAEKLNTAEKIVLSGTLAKAPWGKWPEARIEPGAPAAVIGKLRAQPGKDIVLWGSLSLAQALMQQDLVDEYLLNYCPIVAGGGRQFFTEASAVSSLSLVETRRYGASIAHVHYQRISPTT